MTTDPQTPVARHWIDGKWRDSAQHHDSFDPATGEKIGTYAVGGAGEAKEAVAAALRAFRETDWKTNRELRARVLLEMADVFEARTPELIQAICRENGKVGGEAGLEVSIAAPGLRYAASLVLHDYGRAAESGAGRFALLVREPGVKRCGLELGGMTPMIVFDAGDVDAALPKLEKALTVFAGQFCMTGSRLLVQRGVADKLRRGLVARLEAVKVGPASDPTSD